MFAVLTGNDCVDEEKIFDGECRLLSEILMSFGNEGKIFRGE